MYAACRPGEENRQSDLCAQWKAADSASQAAVWTKYGVLVGFATMLAAAVAAVYARLAANHTRDAARAAWAAEKVARTSAERQLRAYVGAAKLYMTGVAPGEVPVFHYTLKNTGQTPAHRMRVRLSIQVGPRDVRIKFPPGPPPQRLHLGGGSDTDQTAMWRDGSKIMPPLTAEDFAQFVRGDWTFTLAGYVSYVDVFGRTRRTIFRGYAPNQGMTDGKLSMMVAYKHVRAT